MAARYGIVKTMQKYLESSIYIDFRSSEVYQQVNQLASNQNSRED